MEKWLAPVLRQEIHMNPLTLSYQRASKLSEATRVASKGPGAKGGRVFRNNYKGHMDKTKGGRSKGGRWVWLGFGRSGGG